MPAVPEVIVSAFSALPERAMPEKRTRALESFVATRRGVPFAPCSVTFGAGATAAAGDDGLHAGRTVTSPWADCPVLSRAASSADTNETDPVMGWESEYDPAARTIVCGELAERAEATASSILHVPDAHVRGGGEVDEVAWE